ncbi:MAG: hypothetical protein ACTJFV_07720 [Moraxellaceae bacterium]
MCRSFGYYVNNILGVLGLDVTAFVISGAYLANRINHRHIGTALCLFVYVSIVICLTTNT